MKRLPYIAIVIILFAIISCNKRSEVSYTIRKAEESLSLIPESSGFGVDILLLLDQSGSMNGYPGHPATDPDGLRIDASKYLLNNVAQKSSKDLRHKIGIVNFGSDVPDNAVIPLTETTVAKNDPGTKILLSNLKTLSLGDTSFIQALEAAYREFSSQKKTGQSRKKVIIIFTDGEPDDPRNLSLDEYFQEIDSFVNLSLKSLGCDIYVIGIDTAGTSWDRSAPRWERILTDKYVYQISGMEQLRERFNETVRQIFGIPLVPPDIVTSSGIEFDVPPYLDRIEFHIFPENADTKLSIIAPDSKEVGNSSLQTSVEEYENYSIVTVQYPPYGKWKYQIKGGTGPIEVYRNAIPIGMKLVSPADTHPLGKPIDMLISFLRSDGRDVIEMPQFPLGLTGKVIAPDGKESDVKFVLREGGLCYGSPRIEYTNLEGIHRIILTIKGGDAHRFSHETYIHVKPTPYAILHKPEAGSTIHFNDELNIKAGLMEKEKPAKAEELFFDHPDVLILAQLVQMPDGNKSEPIWLSQASEFGTPGVFHGTIPVSLDQKGSYILMTRLAGKSRSGDIYPIDYNRVEFYVYPSLIQKLLGTSRLALYIAGIIIALAIAIWLVWLLTLPRMRGSIYIYIGDPDSGIPLAQERLDRKKFRYIRVKKKSGISLWINRDRRSPTRIRIKRNFLSRPRILDQNSSVRIGRNHSLRYM
ncbi:VWA domain-containing protein [Candidatus Poribacteria bacterium]|nr:VWA domain-containing protein [Candidatus Poribacteria bacterium]